MKRFLLACALLAGCVTGASAQTACVGYAASATITITYPVKGLTDFPWHLHLTDPMLKDQSLGGSLVTGSGGKDICFADSKNLIQYPYSKHSVDTTAGVLDTFVKLPKLAKGVKFKIFVGKSGVSAGQWSNSATFSNGYTAVYGFGYSGQFDATDLSGNQADVSPSTGAGAVAGIQGLGYGDQLTVADSASLRPADAITISMWVKYSGDPESFATFLSKPYPVGGYPYWSYSLVLWSGGGRPAMDVATAGTMQHQEADTATLPNDGQYHMITGYYNRTSQATYMDGTLVRTWTFGTDQGPIDYAGGTTPLVFGIGGGSTSIDQVEISSGIVRSPEWIAAEYNTMVRTSNYTALSVDPPPQTFDSGSPVKVEIKNVGPTVAFAYIRNSVGPCKWNLVEGTDITADPHADVNASLDTSRPDTLTDEYGTRIMRIGHDYGDFPLGVGTQYTFFPDRTDTGCLSVPPVTFSTATQPPPVATRALIPKWNANTYTKLWTPNFDWSPSGVGKSYVVPFSGTRYKFFQPTGTNRWNHTLPGITDGSMPALVIGGSGWTDPTYIANGDAAHQASIPNTNPAIILPLTNHMRGFDQSGYQYAANIASTFEALGIGPAYGNTTGTSATDKKLKLCFTTNTASTTPTCRGNGGFIIDLPTGSVQQIKSDEIYDGNGTWPSDWPNGWFAGWGAGVNREEMVQGADIVGAVSSGVVNTSVNWNTSYIPNTVEGNYVVIPNNIGAGGADNLFKVAKVDNAGQLHLADTSVNIPAANITGRMLSISFGIIVQRVTASTGTITFGAKVKAAGELEDGQDTPPYYGCHPTTYTQNGIKGNLCFSIRASDKVLHFTPQNPEIQSWPVSKLTQGQMNLGGSNTMFESGRTTITDVRDMPLKASGTGPEDPFVMPIGFDLTAGNKIYVTAQCDGGNSYCLYRITFRDMSDQTGLLGDVVYATGATYATTATLKAGDPFIENVTPVTTGKDLISQIATKAPWTSQGMYANYTSWSPIGFSGKTQFWYKHAPAPEQDNWQVIVAAQNAETGNVYRVFSTHYEGETGGIPELRFAAQHSISAMATAIPNAFIVSAEWPGNGNSSCHGCGAYLSAPIAVKPLGVYRGGTLSTNLELSEYPYTSGAGSDYDKACPDPATVPEYMSRRWSNPTTECVKIRFYNQICLEQAPTTSANLNYLSSTGTAETCDNAPPAWTGASSWTKTQWQFREGDRMVAYFPNTDAGWTDQSLMMIVKITATGSGWVEAILHRDDAVDTICVANSKTVPNHCVTPTHRTYAPDGWYGRMVSGRNESKGEATFSVQFNPDTGDYVVAEQNQQISGHTGIGPGVIPGTTTIVSNTLTMKNVSMAQFGIDDFNGLPSDNIAQRTGIQHAFAGRGSEYAQAYLNRTANTGWASQWTADANHLNGSGGPSPLGNARNFVSIANCPDVYRLTPMNGDGYKTATMFGYAGHNVLEDVGGTNVDICNAHDYSMLRVMPGDNIGITPGANGGETPAAGYVYVKVPHAYTATGGDGCQEVQVWVNNPCVMFLSSKKMGGYRRFWSERDDIDPGGASRYEQGLMQMSPSFPGSHYFFSGSWTTPPGTGTILQMGFVIDGVRNPSLFMHLPDFSVDETKLNRPFNNTSISVAAVPGATHARIKFGFEPGTFYCAGRKEACYTDTAHNSTSDPYAFEHEATSPQSCSSGCTIQVPFDLGVAEFYQIEWLNGGNVVRRSRTNPIVAN